MVQGLVFIHKAPWEGPLPLQQAAEWSLSDDTMPRAIHCVHAELAVAIAFRQSGLFCRTALDRAPAFSTVISLWQPSLKPLFQNWGWHCHRAGKAPWQSPRKSGPERQPAAQG